MTAEQATQDILYLVYEAAIISPDPIVQETHVETSVRDILEELVNFVPSEVKELDHQVRRLEEENDELEADNESLREKVKELEADLEAADEKAEKLRFGFNASQELLGEYVGK